MLRAPQGEIERSATQAQLGRARELMIEALTILDDVPVFTGCDAYLDHAIHDLTEFIKSVEISARVFDIRQGGDIGSKTPIYAV